MIKSSIKIMKRRSKNIKREKGKNGISNSRNKYQRGFKSDCEEQLNTPKIKKREREIFQNLNDVDFEKIGIFTQVDFDKDSPKKRKAKRNKLSLVTKDNSYSEFRRQTRSMDRKNKDPEEKEEKEKYTEIVLISDSPDFLSPIKIKTPKKHKKKSKCKNIKKGIHIYEEKIKIEENSFYSFKQEEIGQEYNDKKAIQIKDENISDYEHIEEKKRHK